MEFIDVKKQLITRNGAIWWLALILATLGYIKLNGNPSGWNFDQWVAAGIAAATWLIGKLQASPLDSKKDLEWKEAGMDRRGS